MKYYKTTKIDRKYLQFDFSQKYIIFISKSLGVQGDETKLKIHLINSPHFILVSSRKKSVCQPSEVNI